MTFALAAFASLAFAAWLYLRPNRALTRSGGALSRKRTSLFLVEPQRLVFLSDLPSSGDASYAGVVLGAGALIASYYTSDPARDRPWLLGMFLRSDVRIARVPLDALSALAAARADAGGSPEGLKSVRDR